MEKLKQVVFERMESCKKTIKTIDIALEKNEIEFEEAIKLAKTQIEIHSIIAMIIIDSGLWEEYEEWREEKN